VLPMRDVECAWPCERLVLTEHNLAAL
jgi:hypothetical protein